MFIHLCCAQGVTIVWVLVDYVAIFKTTKRL
jgi:hypothetical protein